LDIQAQLVLHILIKKILKVKLLHLY